MYTGEDDISKMGKIHTWNYVNQTSFDGECGAITGSAGGFYPPQTRGDKLQLFSHEACRTLAFNFAGNTTVHGVPGNVYALDATTFANANLIATVAGSAGKPDNYTHPMSGITGTRHFWARTLNPSGVPSNPVGPITRTF